MAAPKDNEFWKLRAKHGRDKLFETPALLEEAAYEYFSWCQDTPLYRTDFRGKDADEVHIPLPRPFTLTGLCLYCDASEQFWRTFKASGPSEDFLAVISRIEQIIYTQKFEGAVVGLFNANIISRDLGLVDKKEVAAELKLEPITGMRILSSINADPTK
ncbi:DNA-packaging protein [Spirosoma sp. BT702]|uniref:DNA-packaging protein n=1 Tax=Spirosoma profusum TaxID=2771354 RepID=A0A927ASG3_9BACT|nr:DNA-packaging protein [Spirosoma profusum]MBD2703796.1 DNA-packaging protein [Spirosoma profusum]